jgi:hypothetical protein
MTVRPSAITGLGLIVLAALPSRVDAQGFLSNRVSVELVGSVSTSSLTPDDPFIVLDGTATVRIGDRIDFVVRPYLRRLPGGECSTEMYQLQIRYQPDTRLPLRVDAGIIASPLGIASLEMRPDRNPLIGPPSYYFTPLPSFDGTVSRVQLLSGGYPLGAMLSASGTRWDARGGVIDGTPTRSRRMMWSTRPPADPQFVAGAGVTPIAGLRVGAGFARGAYRSRPTPTAPVAQTDHLVATVFNVEGDYSVGYTRVSAEWIRDAFETDGEPAISRGYTLQAVRTLSARWFAAGRTTRVTTPVFVKGVRVRRASATADATVGYRVTTDLTLRGGYQGSHGYASDDWGHAAVASVVWAKRFW